MSDRGDQSGADCDSCDTPAPPGARFCGQCGAALAPPPVDEGERRPVTVVFCDLVGSTELAVAHDAEDMRDVLRAYHDVAAGALTAAGGMIARFMGDGILCFFGYPTASEDAARRAVEGCLAAVERVAAIETDLTRDLGLDLSCRAGVHSGMAFVGPMGTGARMEAHDIVGDTPNIAARVQGRAEPHQVVVSDATHHLIEGWFETVDLGPQSLKGLSEPMTLHLVEGSSAARTRLDVGRARGLAPFVGRHDERADLVGEWEAVRQGRSRSVLVVGEAGVGKSRLLDESVREMAERRPLRVQCDPVLQTSPLGAFAEELERLGPDRAVEPEEFRARWLARLADSLLTTRPADDPALVLVEDVQWADPTTLDLLEALHDDPRPSLILLTLREPGPRPSWCRVVELESLGPEQSALLARTLGADDELATAVVERCAGVPLFIEETLRMRSLGDVADLPASLRDLLVAALDGTGEARTVAQVASVVGREFDEADVDALLAGEREAERGSPEGADALASGLDVLEQALLIERQGTGPRWRFRHALIQDAAYEVTLRDRRRRLHGAVADRYTDRGDEVPAEAVARHLERAERLDEAVSRWEQAGRRAERRWFHAEASAHWAAALSCLARLPESDERDHQELRLRTRHLTAVQSHHDHADAAVGRAIDAAEPLARRLGGADLILLVFPMATHAQAVGDYDRGERVLAEARAMALESSLEPMVPLLDQITGVFRVWQGDVIDGEELIEQSLAASGIPAGLPGKDIEMAPEDPRRYMVTGTLGIAAIAASLRGREDEAEDRIDQAVALTSSADQQVARSLLWVSEAIRHALRGDRDGAHEAARGSIDAVAELGGRQWTPWARVIDAWARRSEGEMEGAFAALAPAGRQLRPLLLTLRADTVAPTDPDNALGHLADAEALFAEHGERFCEPLLWRVRAAVRRELGDDNGAEADDARADEVAQAQGAELFLRARQGR